MQFDKLTRHLFYWHKVAHPCYFWLFVFNVLPCFPIQLIGIMKVNVQISVSETSHKLYLLQINSVLKFVIWLDRLERMKWKVAMEGDKNDVRLHEICVRRAQVRSDAISEKGQCPRTDLYSSSIRYLHKTKDCKRDHSWNKAVWKPKGFTRENCFQQISRKRLVWEQSWRN